MFVLWPKGISHNDFLNGLAQNLGIQLHMSEAKLEHIKANNYQKLLKALRKTSESMKPTSKDSATKRQLFQDKQENNKQCKALLSWHCKIAIFQINSCNMSSIKK